MRNRYCKLRKELDLTEGERAVSVLRKAIRNCERKGDCNCGEKKSKSINEEGA